MRDIAIDRSNAASVSVTAIDSKAGGIGSQHLSIPIITHYLRIAYRWKWLIVGTVALSLLVAIIVTLLATPQYTAVTRIEVNRETGRIVNVADVQPTTSTFDNEFYQTQYGLLRSRSLAQRVATKLRLADSAAFFETFGDAEAFDRIAVSANGSPSHARELRLRAVTDTLLSHVEIVPMRLSRLVEIRFASPDRDFSAQVANQWATSFIESNLERRFDATSYARRFLEQRLGQLRTRLEQSERELVGYASNQAIINIPIAGPDGSRGTQERSLTADSLAALNAELAQAMGERIRAESRARGGGETPEALANVAISSLRQRRAEAAAERARLLTQFEPAYPPVVALDSQISQLDRSIAREEGRVRSTLGNTLTDAVEREGALARQVEALKQTFLDQRRRSIQYNIFQREVDTNRELYDGLLQRYKEIGVAGGVGTNNVSIVDRAQAPERPSRPRPLINLMLALLAGLGLGVGLALVREQIDETFADPSEVEKKLGYPLIGVIPRSENAEPLADLEDPKSSLVEAYLSVQTNLAFSTDHGIPRTLAFTSTRPGEGKSVTAYAVAQLLARNGTSVILVDADMRSPSVHSEANLSNDQGLSNFLAGTSDLDKLIQQAAGVPFAVLLAGPQPPNAAELLRSDRFVTLIAELLKKYKHVIIDSPPVMGLADAPIIGSRAEAIAFVIETRGVSGRLARLALSRLEQARGHILGTVLTKFEVERAHYGYGYEYGYKYGLDDRKAQET